MAELSLPTLNQSAGGRSFEDKLEDAIANGASESEMSIIRTIAIYYFDVQSLNKIAVRSIAPSMPLLLGSLGRPHTAPG